LYSSNIRRPFRWALLPLILVVLAVTAIGVSLYLRPASPPYYGWWSGGPFGWFFFIPLFFVAFFALRFLWWGTWGAGGWYHQEDSAVQVLRERFARGEITKEQLEQMRKDMAQG
jgi:putative membrane protein